MMQHNTNSAQVVNGKQYHRPACFHDQPIQSWVAALQPFSVFQHCATSQLCWLALPNEWEDCLSTATPDLLWMQPCSLWNLGLQELHVATHMPSVLQRWTSHCSQTDSCRHGLTFHTHIIHILNEMLSSFRYPWHSSELSHQLNSPDIMQRCTLGDGSRSREEMSSLGSLKGRVARNNRNRSFVCVQLETLASKFSATLCLCFYFEFTVCSEYG